MPSILGKHGIETIVDLPVGENLQDHLMVSLNFLLSPESQGIWYPHLFHISSLTTLLADLKVVPVAGDIENVAGKEYLQFRRSDAFLV